MQYIFVRIRACAKNSVCVHACVVFVFMRVLSCVSVQVRVRVYVQVALCQYGRVHCSV